MPYASSLFESILELQAMIMAGGLAVFGAAIWCGATARWPWCEWVADGQPDKKELG